MEYESRVRVVHQVQSAALKRWTHFAYSAALGFVMTISVFAEELIINGGFELGTTGTSTLGWNLAGPVVVSGPYFHTGTRYLIMGELANNTDVAYQDIAISSTASTVTLSYWYNIVSGDTSATPHDILTVTIRNTIGYPGGLLATVDSKSNVNRDAGAGSVYYHQNTYDLASYKGSTIRIYFQAVTIGVTSFKIDDVSVATTVPPTVVTSDPTMVTVTSVRLNGTVNPNGLTASGWFQYGTTTSYGNATSPSTLFGSGINTPQAIQFDLTGLNPGTLYHYRAASANTDDFGYGQDKTFTTSASETISTPGTIIGEANPVQNVLYSYTVGASTSSLGHTVEYSFDWGDGTTSSFSTSTSDSHSWSTTGSKSIVVTARCQTHTGVSNNNSPGKSVTVSTQLPAPVAGFSGDLQPVTGKFSTYNGGYSTGTGLSYSWALSDGRTSTVSAPSFAFNSPGTYTISLTVTDSMGRTSTASATLYVQASNNGSTPGQPVGADPVVLSAGNYVQERVDLRMPGKGFPFEFKRFYNSKFGDQTGLPLGFGWTHAYNERIKDTGTNALVVRGDGSTWTFFQSGGGFTNEPGVFDFLVHNGDSTWSLTDKSQTVKRFDSTGHLTSITDKNGNVLNLSYTGGVLRQIQDTAGRNILINTNALGCISEITDPIGRSVVFQYDPQTNLVATVDADSGTSRYSYGGNHQLTDAFDSNGNCFVHNEYDTNTFVVLKQRDAFTNWTFFAYDVTNRITYQTNVLGKVSVHVFDEHLLATNLVDEAARSQSFAYDGNRNRIQIKDKNGNFTSYGYDARGNVTNKTDALTNATTVEYDTINNPTKRIDSLNHFTTFAYNASGNLTQTTNALAHVSLVDYNASGLPLVLTDGNGHKTTNTFDIQGNLIKVQDALGSTTAFGYDGAGRKVAQTNGNNQVIRYFYDNNDNLLRVVDPLNHTNFYFYDANNNRTVTIDARGAATTNIFDSKDRLTSVRDARGSITSYGYDALDRKTKETDARNRVTKFGYDDVGNLVASTNALNQVTRYTYDANANQTSIINPFGQTTTNIFDTLNRPIMTIDPLGHTNRTVYDALGRRVQTVDSLNRTNHLAYDFIGRLTKVTDANTGTTTFTYDNVGNRLVTTDASDHSTTNTFDVLNHLVKIREPGGGLYQFAYDRIGNRTNQVDPKGETIRYSFDDNNRRTSLTYPTGSPVMFGYDANGNRTGMTDSMGTTIYQYDSLNRLISVTDPFGKTVSYVYDANGNRVSLTYPGGKTVNYVFDSLNRMVFVTDWLSGVTAYTYDAAGNLIHTANPNGSAVDYGYDTASRLTFLTNSGPNSSIISSYAYTLDAVGNHTQVDQMEQLQTLPVVGAFNYSYDNDNRMLSFEGQPEAFDAKGNIISINNTNLLSYDFENRLTQTDFPVVTNSYQYDGAGNRLSANREGLVTRYVLDRSSPLTQVLAETDSGGTITAYYVYGLGLISRMDAVGNVQYYHFDSRGSTIGLTAADGHLTEAYAYDPFGRPRKATVSENRFRYLGRHGVMDEFNGLDYIRARYYSTRRGRFISKDPTTGNDSDGQSLNRYVYALNNPVRLIDISGLSPREASHISFVFATSDSSGFHNLLISPSTLGLDTRVAGSTPQLQTAGNSEPVNQALAPCKLSGDGSVIRAPTTQELIYQRELELMHIDSASPFAAGERRDFITENPGESLLILKLSQQEVLGSDYMGWSASEGAAFGIFTVFGAVELLDFQSEQQTILSRHH